MFCRRFDNLHLSQPSFFFLHIVRGTKQQTIARRKAITCVTTNSQRSLSLAAKPKVALAKPTTEERKKKSLGSHDALTARDWSIAIDSNDISSAKTRVQSVRRADLRYSGVTNPAP